MIVIRRGRRTDWLGAATVNVRGWQFAYRELLPDAFLDALTPAQWAGWRERYYANPPPHAAGLVASDGEVRGYCDVGRSRSTDRAEITGELLAIYVDPDSIGSGVGARLIESGRAALVGLGHSVAELWVVDSNERARRFYERDGWELAAETKVERMGGVDINEVRYVREL